MSDIPGELARVQGAFQQPTLTLLHQKLAPVIIAIFRNSVTLDVRTIDAARLPSKSIPTSPSSASPATPICPPAAAATFACAGCAASGPSTAPRPTLPRCTPSRRTRKAALNLVKGLTRERASLSKHRIATIIAAVRRFNTEEVTGDHRLRKLGPPGPLGSVRRCARVAAGRGDSAFTCTSTWLARTTRTSNLSSRSSNRLTSPPPPCMLAVVTACRSRPRMRSPSVHSCTLGRYSSISCGRAAALSSCPPASRAATYLATVWWDRLQGALLVRRQGTAPCAT